MKKFHGLKLLGLVAILAFSLVLVGINYAQGQGKGKKPPGKDEGEKYAWSAIILNGPFSIQGREESVYDDVGGYGSYYDGSEENINVTNFVKVVNPKNPTQVRSDFTLEIFYFVLGETLYQIDFIDEHISDEVAYFDLNPFRDNWPPVSQDLNPDLVYKYLGFPPFAPAITNPATGDPLKIFDFMQNYGHPSGPGVEEDYYKVRLHFSSKWADNLIDGTYDSWPIGDIEANRKPMGYGGELGNFSIEGQNIARRHCDHGDYNVWNYHNIRGDENISGDEIWAGWPGYIVRIDEDIWKVVVDGHTNIYEEYCECVVTRANKNRPTRTWLTVMRPTFGSCYMNFEMLFIRTKI